MSTDAETAEQMTAEGKRLDAECSQLRAELAQSGRTDVPLDDPRHVNNADEATRATWFAKYKEVTLKDIEAQTMRNRASMFRNRAARNEAPPNL